MNEQPFLRCHPFWPNNDGAANYTEHRETVRQSLDYGSVASPPPSALSTLPPCLHGEDLQKTLFIITMPRLFQWSWTLRHPISFVLPLWPSFRLWNSIIAHILCNFESFQAERCTGSNYKPTAKMLRFCFTYEMVVGIKTASGF